MSAALKPPARMTVAEFLDWPGDSTGALWQLVDGEPTAMAPPSERHGRVQGTIASLLDAHLQASRPSCSVIVTAGIVPRAKAGNNIRIPDIAVTCGPERSDTPLTIEPVLAVEILSPSNHAETWSNVWTYLTIPSLMEVLVVTALTRSAEVLRRLPDGSWPPEFERVTDPDALVRLDCIGAAFPLRLFYRSTDLAIPG